MSNLEEYLGLRILISREIDPNSLASDVELIRKLKDVVGFNPEEFFIFVHDISFYRRVKDRGTKVSDLIDSLELTFKVNEKQRGRSGSIRFYNFFSREGDRERGVTEHFESAYNYKRIFDGWYLDEHVVITSKLVTYISRNLVRKDFRKIKIEVKFSPIDTAGENKLTEIDLSLDAELKLNLRGLSPAEIREVHSTVSSFRNNFLGKPPEIEVDLVKQQPLFNTGIDFLDNQLRQFGVTNQEVSELHEIARKRLFEKDSTLFSKKYSNWLGNIVKRSLEKKLQLPTDDISEVADKIMGLVR